MPLLSISQVFSKVLHKSLFKPQMDLDLEKIMINSIVADSRRATADCLFVCVPGYTVDGHDFAASAVANGAVALLVERKLDIDVLQVIVPDVQQTLPLVAATFYDHPAEKVKLIGVTGTNGKTTTTYMLEKIFKDSNKKTGLIGTIEMRIGEDSYPVENTTPDSLTMQENLYRMQEADVDYCIIEVSSHALRLGRVNGCRFTAVAFTNLTQDHLDFHENMDDYLQAKTLLFSRLGNSYNSESLQYGVINQDDPTSQAFKKSCAMQVLTYGIDQAADIRATDIIHSANGVKFKLNSVWSNTDVQLQMAGKFSVYNALTAIALAFLNGISIETAVHSLEAMTGVPGRFELVKAGQNFIIIVDYAHTADSLQNVLETIREFSQGKIITVFGCGGDRDRKKRPLMGAVARELSDYAVITSDNPRTENVAQIIDDIMIAFRDADAQSYIRIDDRTAAIRHAVRTARAGDVVLIAGKGHETYQIIGKSKIHYDDRQQAAEAVALCDTH